MGKGFFGITFGSGKKYGRNGPPDEMDPGTISLILIIAAVLGIVLIVAGFLLSSVNPSALIYIGIVLLIVSAIVSFLDVSGRLRKILRNMKRRGGPFGQGT